MAAAEHASRVAADGQLERERLSAAKAAADEHARMAERGQAVAEARAEVETVRAAALGENVGRLEGRVATAEARSRELEAALQEAVAAAEAALHKAVSAAEGAAEEAESNWQIAWKEAEVRRDADGSLSLFVCTVSLSVVFVCDGYSGVV